MGRKLAAISATILALGAAPAPAAGPPTITITLEGRTACVTPHTRNQARADGGIIEVTSGAAGTVSASLTGTTAANAFLGRTGSASQSFHLEQEFEITCSDPAVRTVDLTLDSALVGYVRARHKAGAGVVKACIEVTPLSYDASPLAASHPSLAVEGGEGRLCNQHLPPLKAPNLPLGRYRLVADFILQAEAGGLCDGHAAADFSPTTALPADWVRLRDPFQGVDKKSFGFSNTLTVEPTGASPFAASRPTARGEILRTSATIPATRKPRVVSLDAKGYDRTLRR